MFTCLQYIRHYLSRGRIPQLMLMSKEGVFSSLPKNTFTMPAYVMKGMCSIWLFAQVCMLNPGPSALGVSALQDINKQNTKSLWKMDAMLTIRINGAMYVNVREKGEIYIKTGIYHGTESLCPNQDTQKVESSNPKWNQWLEYDLCLLDIPRCARLCVALCCVSKKQKKKVSSPVRLLPGDSAICILHLPAGALCLSLGQHQFV